MLDAPYLETKLRLYRNRLHRLLTSPAQFLLTLFVVAGIWTALYFMWGTGLYYIARMPWLDFLVFPGMFSVFFVFLFFLLGISSLVLHTNGLYHKGEAELLLHLPIAPSRAAMYRSTELSILNGLGGLYAMSPLLVAAITLQRAEGGEPVTAFNGAWTLLFLLPLFLVIPNTLGAIAAVTARRFAGRSSMALLIGVAALLAVGGLASALSHVDGRLFTEELPPGRIVRLSHEALAGVNAWFLPSRWLVRAFFAPVRGGLAVTAWYTGVLATCASACLLAWATVMRRLYYRSWLAVNVTDSAAAAHVARPNRMAQWSRWPAFVPEHVGTLLLKDAILFMRNRVVRTQGALLVGPLLLYFFAVPVLYASLAEDRWQSLLIGATNIGAVVVLMSAVACRFLLPLVGVEGRKFWLLRMAPPRLSTLLAQKWTFATLVLLALSQPLVLLSNIVARVDPVFASTAHVGLFVLAPTIAAICIGIGALFPDLMVEDEERGADGAAATVALLVSLAAAGVLMGGVALAYREFLYSGEFHVAERTWRWLGDPAFRGLLRRNFIFGTVTGGVVGLFALLLGHARLRRVEIP